MRVSAQKNGADILYIVQALLIVSTISTPLVGRIAELLFLVKNILFVGVEAMTRSRDVFNRRVVDFVRDEVKKIRDDHSLRNINVVSYVGHRVGVPHAQNSLIHRSFSCFVT